MSGRWDVTDPEFRILLVCTGNICRSPLAEYLLRDGLDEVAPGQFRVTSAGTGAWDGGPAAVQVRRFAEQRDVSLSDFASTRLGPEHIEDADLVLTMERSHRSAVVQLAPAALRRTFTLREFARILPLVPPESRTQPAQRWHSLAALTQRYRRPAPDSQTADDVIDPYGRSDAVYTEMFDQMVPALDSLISWERRFSADAT
ncbi:low molecular weight phosphatase family protein [Brevibacterium marinum]|uniref:arsenate reductase/protein-tyrosine-phosphatase family protein n=1 Tax=Brevibacterium marinum TaxID=418643 RepID=UPI001439E584|nr:low molecular weight phosphatase family protein [Brevibacterium marinum]